jgi:cell wall-associated NlpC family hydrolase
VDSPQPGDIIVTPGHVGLYAGPGLQIDSPRPGKTIEFRAIWQVNPVYIRVTG